MEELRENIEQIKKEIYDACQRTGRNPQDITTIAVTKQVSSKRAVEVIESGVCDLGENRPEGLLSKQADILDRNLIWHFIGNVQSRKVKDMINGIDYLHSLDRLSVAKEIQKRADHTVNCFVQVNVSGEESKSGLQIEEVEEFVQQLQQYDKIKVVGLMTMAPFTDDNELIRSVFRSLRKMRDEMSSKELKYAPCTLLSMGMSNDYVIAIEEGATHVRIGTALVGTESEGEG